MDHMAAKKHKRMLRSVMPSPYLLWWQDAESATSAESVMSGQTDSSSPMLSFRAPILNLAECHAQESTVMPAQPGENSDYLKIQVI